MKEKDQIRWSTARTESNHQISRQRAPNINKIYARKNLEMQVRKSNSNQETK